MRFEAHSVVVAILLQGLELSNPIHDASSDGRPLVFSVRKALYVLAVAVTDTLFRQQVVAGWVGCVVRESGGVAGVPVQHEVLVRNCIQDADRFFSGSGVAG